MELDVSAEGCSVADCCRKGARMRGLALWLIGLPIPIIILLYVLGVL